MRLYPDSTEYNGPAATWENSRTPSYWESMKAGAYDVWTEERPLMSHFVDYGPDVTAQLEMKIQGARKDKIIPDEVLDYYGDDLDGISNWGFHNKIEGFQSGTELKDSRRREHHSRKAEMNRIREQSGFIGKSLAFGSGLATYLSEPLYIIPIAPATAAATIGSAMLRGAITEGIVETVGLYPKWLRKDELQVKYGPNDMLLDVAFATVGGGVLAGGGKLATQGIKMNAGKMAGVLRGWEEGSPIGPMLRPLRNTFEQMDKMSKALDMDTDVKKILEEQDVMNAQIDSGAGVRPLSEGEIEASQQINPDSYIENRYDYIRGLAKPLGTKPAKVTPITQGPPDKFQPDMPEGWDTRYIKERGVADKPPTTKETSDALRLKMEGEQIDRNKWVQEQLRTNMDQIEQARTTNNMIKDCLGGGGIV